MKIGKVTDKLYVGGDPIFSDDLAHDIDVLNRCDVILDLREETGDDGWDEYTYTYVVRVGMHDDGHTANTSDQFHEALDLLTDLARDRFDLMVEDLTVYVHCHMGVNRAPSMAMFLLLALHDWDIHGAFERIREARPVAQVAYATEAIRAFLDLYDGEDDDDVMAMWKEYEATYWKANAKAKREIVRWVKARHRQGWSYTDDEGRIHALAKQGG